MPYNKEDFSEDLLRKAQKSLATRDTELKVGMGGAMQIGSDRYPFTVVKVRSPREIVIQRDNYVHGVYEPNAAGHEEVLTLRKNGRWIEKGTALRRATYLYSFGKREFYQAPEF